MTRTPPIGAVLTAKSAKLLEPGDVLEVSDDTDKGLYPFVHLAGAQVIFERPGPGSDIVLDNDPACWRCNRFTFVSRPSHAQEPSVPAGEGEDRREADAALADLGFNMASDLSKGHWSMADAVSMIEGLATRLAALSLPAPEASGAGGWRPIDTAPKDGTEVDLWVFWPESGKHRRTPDAFWNEEHQDWQMGDYRRGQYVYKPEITHWMPLPAAPVQADSTEGVGA